MADFSVVSTSDTEAPKQRLGTTQLLFRAAETMNLAPEWLTPNGVFAVTVQGKEIYVNDARSPLNSVTSVSLCKNKYLTRRVLARHGAQNIPFIKTHSLEQATDFLSEHTKIIAKPISGSGAKDIHMVTSQDQLEDLRLREYILEKYISGIEFRYLILNNRVIAVHQSEYGTSVEHDRALIRISHEEQSWDPALVASSLQIATALGLRFAAVDFMVDDQGYAYVLEVNSMPGLKWFHAPSSGPAVDVAMHFMTSLLDNASQ